MKTLKYVLLFTAIQLAAFVLAIIGLPICAVLPLLPLRMENLNTQFIHAPTLWHYPKLAWLWDNDEDGVFPAFYAREHLNWSVWRIIFTWTALRNPVNNLRFVRGVSLKGRPLWRKEWGPENSYGFPSYYAQAGWNSSGYPVLSGGRNENPF